MIEPTGIFVNESPVLVEALTQRLVDFDLRRHIILRGVFPSAMVPPFMWAGEGMVYHQHSIPTVAHIAAPRPLIDEEYGLRPSI